MVTPSFFSNLLANISLRYTHAYNGRDAMYESIYAAPDPALSKYLKHRGFGVAAILPDWIEDPASLNVGVMVLYENPDFARR